MKHCACGNEALDLRKIALCQACLNSIRKLEDARITAPLHANAEVETAVLAELARMVKRICERVGVPA